MTSFKNRKKSTASNQISVSDFKAHALKYFDQASNGHCHFIVTRHGEPIAEVTPMRGSEIRNRCGSLKELAEIHGDIVQHDSSDDWDALRE